jgi:ribosomal protein L7/L12
MNRDDIIKALLTSNISFAEVQEAMDTATRLSDSINEARKFAQVDISSLQSNVNVARVACFLKLKYDDVESFFNAHDWTYYKDRKITLIREFREAFPCGLADAKGAVEILATGVSDTQMSVFGLG